MKLSLFVIGTLFCVATSAPTTPTITDDEDRQVFRYPDGHRCAGKTKCQCAHDDAPYPAAQIYCSGFDGAYGPLQCGYTGIAEHQQWYCYCARRDGTEVEGTRVDLGPGDKHESNRCLQYRPEWERIREQENSGEQ